MPYTLEETGTLERTANVVVSGEDFRTSYNKALKQLSKRVRISGFRKGKVPMSVMKRQYGGSVLNDVIQELVDEHVNQMLQKEENVIYLGQPNIESLPSEEEGMNFTVTFELRPTVDPVGYMGVEVGKPEVSIEDAAIDERIEQLRTEHATLEPIKRRKTIREGDTVTLDFKAVGDEPELEPLQGTDMDVTIGEGKALPGIEEALLKKKFDAEVTTTITIEDNFPIEELRGKDVELNLVVKSVKVQTLPKVDDEFALDTGMGKTVDEMRENIREELAEDLNARAEQIARDNLIQVILDDNDFELPPQFLVQQTRQAIQAQLEQLMQQGIDYRQLGLNPDDMIDNMKGDQAMQLKREFLLMAIADTEKVDVSEEELKAAVASRAKDFNVDSDTYMRFLSSDRDRMMQFAAGVRLEKTMNILMAEASFVPAEWPTEGAEEQ